MPIAFYIALLFTVALMVTTLYFLLGGLPLLTLRHDTPMDARFVRGFFRLYYKTVFVAALGASLGFAIWGKPAFALATAAMALLAQALRRYLIEAMQRLDERIQANHEGSVRRFRRVHGFALSLNLLQLVVLVWGLNKLFA